MFNFYQDFSDPEKSVFRWHMRRLILFVSILVLALVVSYGVDIWKEIKGLRGEAKLQIAVSGEGTVSATPDVARITATILTTNELLKVAQEENSRRSNVLVDYLKKQGIQEKDVKTTGYNIYPQYSYPRPCPLGIYPCPPEDQRPRIVGYQIRNSYEITIRDLSKAGEVLAGAVSSGANEVSGISFTIDNPDALEAEARKKAIDNANEKARALAKDLGRRLGKITQFSEGGSFPPPIYLERAPAAFGGKGGGGEPAIEPGENEIVVTVSITYEFR